MCDNWFLDNLPDLYDRIYINEQNTIRLNNDKAFIIGNRKDIVFQEHKFDITFDGYYIWNDTENVNTIKLILGSYTIIRCSSRVNCVHLNDKIFGKCYMIYKGNKRYNNFYYITCDALELILIEYKKFKNNNKMVKSAKYI